MAMTALALTTALGACSGDSDNESDASKTPAASASDGGGTPPEEQFQRKCTADVEVTGEASASWSGAGTVTNASGPTMYQSVDGKNQVIIYAGKGDIPTNANVTVGKDTFTSEADAKGLDVDLKGSSAKADVDVTGVDGIHSHLTATFTCAKAGKGGKGDKQKG